MKSCSSWCIETWYWFYVKEPRYNGDVTCGNYGWQNFTEGKLSKWWRQLQALYYWDRASRWSATCWAMGLVTRLLEMVHDVWKYRNSILHEHDEQGLTWQAVAELKTVIEAKFAQGIANLARCDQHFIWRGLDNILSLLASDKQAWLHGIQLARESHKAIPMGIWSQWELMENYFGMSTWLQFWAFFTWSLFLVERPSSWSTLEEMLLHGLWAQVGRTPQVAHDPTPSVWEHAPAWHIGLIIGGQVLLKSAFGHSS